MRGILSIQSEVVYGHVGNSVARFALQRLGHEVWSVPTVLYSNHPGHGDFGGENIHADDMSRLLDALDRQGHLAQCTAVLTGYARTAEQVAFMADAVARVKKQSPNAIFCCDPVLGDVHTGVYVPLDVADAIPRDLVPLADFLTPNLFELETLSGLTVTDPASAIAASRALSSPLVLATSIPDNSKITTIAVTPEASSMVATEFVDDPPHGVGDLVAALFLGHTLNGATPQDALTRAVSTVFELLRRSSAVASDELLLVDHQDLMINPPLLAVQQVSP